MSCLRRRAIVVSRARSPGAQLDRRPGQRPRRRGRVVGVGEHPQPGDRVAHLGPLEERRRPGEVEGDAALFHRRGDGAALLGRVVDQDADLLRRRRPPRPGARPPAPPPAPGRARWCSARSRAGDRGSAPRAGSARPRDGPRRTTPPPRCRRRRPRSPAPRPGWGSRRQATPAPPAAPASSPRARRPSAGRSARRSAAARRAARPGGSRGRGRRRRGRGCRTPRGCGRGWRRARRTRARAAPPRGRPRRSPSARSACARSERVVGPTRSAFSRSIRASSRASSPAGLPRISCRRSGSSVEAVEQHRQPLGPAEDVEEGVEAGLLGVLAQQALADRVPAADPELLEGALEQRLAALAQAAGGRLAGGDHQHALGPGRRRRPGVPAAAPAARSCRCRGRRRSAAARRRGRPRARAAMPAARRRRVTLGASPKASA